MIDQGLYTKEYFVNSTISNYSDYEYCAGILNMYAGMLYELFKPISVFDAGCAYGHAVRYFNDFYKITAKGCDISEWASSRCEYIYQSSIDNIPEEDAAYQLVTCTEVLEHIPEEKVRDVIKELVRISNKYVVILVAMFPEGTTEDPGDKTHITFHPKEWWLDVVSELGYFRDEAKENWLNGHGSSLSMSWSGRFIVIRK